MHLALALRHRWVTRLANMIGEAHLLRYPSQTNTFKKDTVPVDFLSPRSTRM
jgi:hypothetical protein